MRQYESIETSLGFPVEVPNFLDNFAKFGERGDQLPKGLLGLNLETGLVSVAINRSKIVDMKFGKLLSKLGVPEAEIPDYSAEMSAIFKTYKGVKISFANTADEIAHVYENGPHSCMVDSDSVRAYESPNISLGFVEIGGRIVARAVLNHSDIEDLRYTTTYGDSKLLQKLLERDGYTPGDLDGCTLAKIETDKGIRCPFLDCGTAVAVYSNYLEITQNGDYLTQSVNGYLYQEICECCETPMKEDESMYCGDRDISICSSCWEESTVYVNGEDYWSGSDKITKTEDGEYYLVDEVVDTDDGIYHIDDVVWCEPDAMYGHRDSVVEAIISDLDEKDFCLTIYCTEIYDVWVHDEHLDEYCQLIEQE